MQVCADLLHMVVEGVQVFPRLVRMGEEGCMCVLTLCVNRCGDSSGMC